jgi:hypothetical protein
MKSVANTFTSILLLTPLPPLPHLNEGLRVFNHLEIEPNLHGPSAPENKTPCESYSRWSALSLIMW